MVGISGFFKNSFMGAALKLITTVFFIDKIKDLVYLRKFSPSHDFEREKIVEFISQSRIEYRFKKKFRECTVKRDSWNTLQLFVAYWRCFSWEISKSFLLLTVDNLVKIYYSVILGNLIGVLDSCALRDLLFWAIFLVLAIFLHVFLGQHNWDLMNRLNCCFKHFLIKLLLQKAKRINPFTVNKIDLGKLVNILSGEIKVSSILAIMAAPCTAGICFLLLYQNFRNTSIYCLVFLILIYVFQSFIMKGNARFIKARAEVTDLKMKLISDILLGRQTIVLNSWEEAMERRVQQLRKAEEANIKRVLEVNFLNKMVSSCMPIAMSLILFFMHPHSMSLSLIFSTLQLVNHMSIYIIFYVGSGISTLYEVKTVFTRLVEILNLPDSTTLRTSEKRFLDPDGAPLLSLTNHSVFRTEDHNSKLLFSKSISIEENKKYAVVGATGSGKSIFLRSLINQAPYSTFVARRKQNLKIVFMEQEPFIFAGTLKENILFGAPFEQSRYLNVLQVTCLDHDLERMGANFELFYVEASGQNLSKGQRIRVSLARTLYREAKIYLLDDPFSSLDSLIACRIFSKIEECMKSKTFLITTNVKQLLLKFDKIIAVNKGAITLTELQQDHLADSTLQESLKTRPDDYKGRPPTSNGPREQNKNEPQKAGSRSKPHDKGAVKSQIALVRLIKDYVLYRSKGSTLLCFILLVFVLSEGLKLNFFNQIAHLSKFPNEKSRLITFFLLHVALSVIKNELFYSYMIKRASHLHRDLLKTKLLSCFETESPVEGTISRFSSDITKLDQDFILIFRDFIDLLVNYFSFLALAIYAVPIIVIPTVLGFVLFLALYNYFQVTISNIKKVEIELKSKTIADFLNITKGFSTLSAFHRKSLFLSQLSRTSEVYVKSSQTFWGLNRLLYFYLEFLGALLTSVMIIILILNKFAINNNPLLSQCITNTITLGEIIQFNFTLFFQMKIFTLNIENVFSDLDTAAIKRSEEQRCKEDSKKTLVNSAIEFRRVSLKYKTAPNAILNDVSFTIDSGDKIIIIGRTGSGKSTLIRSILACENIECCGADSNSCIKIGGLDFKSIPARLLRKNISTITQEPFFFSGSLRDNLDPLGAHTDEEIMEALGLFKIDKHNLSLSKNIINPSLTAGEKQLFNLVRLTLQKSKIIILDEAVSFLDLAKQKEVMNTLERHVFPGATVLNILHRLEGEFAYDKVFRLDEKGHLHIDKRL